MSFKKIHLIRFIFIIMISTIFFSSSSCGLKQTNLVVQEIKQERLDFLVKKAGKKEKIESEDLEKLNRLFELEEDDRKKIEEVKTKEAEISKEENKTGENKIGEDKKEEKKEDSKEDLKQKRISALKKEQELFNIAFPSLSIDMLLNSINEGLDNVLKRIHDSIEYFHNFLKVKKKEKDDKDALEEELRKLRLILRALKESPYFQSLLNHISFIEEFLVVGEAKKKLEDLKNKGLLKIIKKFEDRVLLEKIEADNQDIQLNLNTEDLKNLDKEFSETQRYVNSIFGYEYRLPQNYSINSQNPKFVIIQKKGVEKDFNTFLSIFQDNDSIKNHFDKIRSNYQNRLSTIEWVDSSYSFDQETLLKKGLDDFIETEGIYKISNKIIKVNIAIFKKRSHNLYLLFNSMISFNLGKDSKIKLESMKQKRFIEILIKSLRFLL